MMKKGLALLLTLCLLLIPGCSSKKENVIKIGDGRVTEQKLVHRMIKMLVEEAYHKTKRILTEHMDQLQKVAEFLFHNEKMSGEEFRAVMEGTYQPPEEKPQSDSFVSDFDTEKH